ncbi:MAG TPA: 5-methyltetrahydropteroyltriglutamate--homocysteine S-methyltransferase [Virgibacillus sp.]|nr:5-methyltetrahydropteroyltriglutamate--homocysteine S-methyltransferase [Virgibacillus sp.]
MKSIQSSNIGYPRIGEKREWKKALEDFWKGAITEIELVETTDQLRLENLKKQQALGVDLIPVGDFTLYDHVLDTSAMFGVVPKRYAYDGGKVDLKTYFAIARGEQEAIASEMTKWFNTNYHYIVPELDDVKPTLVENKPLTFYNEAKEKLGIDGKPVLLGPITYLKLSKGYEEDDFSKLIEQFLPLYVQVLKELAEAGATWVQIDEPIFSTSISKEVVAYAKEVYETFHREVPEINVIFQTYFERIFNYEAVIDLPVKGIGIDFVHGDSLKQLAEYGFPTDKFLAAGIINGRNVWRANLRENITLLESIKQFVSEERLIIQPSTSLLHVPITKKLEKGLDEIIIEGLSFADEKLAEVVTLTKGIKLGKENIEKEIADSERAVYELDAAYRKNGQVKARMNRLKKSDTIRSLPFKKRSLKQQEQLQLPLLPTTTIGSLPQTADVRKTRTSWRKGDITTAEYELFVNQNIKKWIKIQEKLDLDVLVHGEFERNDMVEYFGETLNGFSVTEYGWVQSYGSRCVKPPLITGDVYWDKPVTVKESVYAQSLTNRPVKGMLTGPTTILNWSFAHDDVPADTIMNQIALALRQEVEALEKSGIQVIQVDEPALREGLPLDHEKWEAYLKEAAFAFRLTTSSVAADTQIHTHMCYSDFNGIFATIDALDADVISIETSRSQGELIDTFEENTYRKDIGLGVYDIHSPRIPSHDEISNHITRALKTISPHQFWVNPDCGLKTRNEEEVIAALQVMVEAAKVIRSSQVVHSLN